MTQLSWFSTSGLRFFIGRIAAIPAGVRASGKRTASLHPIRDDVGAPVVEIRNRQADPFRRTGNKQMKANDLVAMRLNWGLSQDSLADRLGLPRQAYVEMEMGQRPLKKSHLLALEEIGIDLCLLKRDVSMLIPEIRCAVDYLNETAQKLKMPVVHAEAEAARSWGPRLAKLQ